MRGSHVTQISALSWSSGDVGQVCMCVRVCACRRVSMQKWCGGRKPEGAYRSHHGNFPIFLRTHVITWIFLRVGIFTQASGSPAADRTLTLSRRAGRSAPALPWQQPELKRALCVLTGRAGVHPLHPRVDERGRLVVYAAAHADALLRALGFARLMLLSDEQRLLVAARESARTLRVFVESPHRVVVAGRSAAGPAIDGGCARLLVVGRRVNLLLHVGCSICGRVRVVS